MQAITTIASYLQFLTKVLKEPSPGTFKASGPTMSARIALLKLFLVSKHRVTGDISARQNLTISIPLEVLLEYYERSA